MPGRQSRIRWGRQWHGHQLVWHQEVDIEKWVRMTQDWQSGRRTDHPVWWQRPVSVKNGHMTAATAAVMLLLVAVVTGIVGMTVRV